MPRRVVGDVTFVLDSAAPDPKHERVSPALRAFVDFVRARALEPARRR